MNISEITFFTAFSPKMGKKNTEFLVAFVKSISRNEIRTFSKAFLTKEDKVELIERISDTKTELNDRITDTKGELIQLISDTKSELIQLISDTKSELTDKISDTKSELTDKISDTKSELTDKINAVHTGLIKWMVALWLSSTALIISVLKFL